MNTATIRASSFWEVLDCPKRWASKYIEGLRTPATAPARIGTAVHRSTAVYDESRVEGTDFVSIDDSADVVVDTIRNPDEEVDWMGMNIDKAIEIGVGCHTKYCSEIGSHMEFAAVEQTLEDLTVSIELDAERSVELTLTGTLDRIRHEADEKYDDQGIPIIVEGWGICDVKTGARAASQNPSRHKAQLGVYELLASQLGHNINLPAQILALQTSSNYKAEVHTVDGARDLLVGTADDPGLLTFVADMLEREFFFGNASSLMCNEKYCPAWNHCRFR